MCFAIPSFCYKRLWSPKEVLSPTAKGMEFLPVKFEALWRGGCS